MTGLRKLPIGQLLPGDEIFERKGSKLVRLGLVDHVTKDVRLRSVTVHLFGGGGWSQNWAAKALVRRVHRGKEI